MQLVCLIDTETSKNSFIENPVRLNQEQAGCEAANLLVQKNINMAIAGRFGSKVVDVFRKNNIQMIIPEGNKTLNDILKQIKK